VVESKPAIHKYTVMFHIILFSSCGENGGITQYNRPLFPIDI
jgi:hypothetical protein